MGRYMSDKMTQRLKNNGLELKSNWAGAAEGMDIDVNKMLGKDTLDPGDIDKVIKDLKLPDGKYSVSGSILSIDGDIGYSNVRRILNNVGDVGKWDIVGHLRTRSTMKSLGYVSVWHPLQKAKNKAYKTATDLLNAQREMEFEFKLEGGNFSRAGAASSEVKKLLKQLNVNPTVIKRIVIALYEAEVNVVAHAWEGVMHVTFDSQAIRVVVADKGPGIPDIGLAMQEGYSTASPEVREMGFGAGMGLPNMKKNCDTLDIQSEVGVGTTVTMITALQ